MTLDASLQLEGSHGSYSLELSREWEIWGPNGGYLAALALRAAGLVAEIKRPATFYCQFLRSPEFQRVELEVAPLKRSRLSEALSVQMTQAGKPVLHALVRTAADAPGYEQQHLEAPSVRSHDELSSIEQLFAEHERPPFRFWENIERRPVEQERVREPGPAERLVRRRRRAVRSTRGDQCRRR
jgi:acyl-CoA thioesterase